MSTEATNFEQLFIASLPLVDRLVAAAARRHALGRADAEDFGAWVRARLIDSDYQVLRKFGGRSALSTYLTVVVANLYRDYRNMRWGRWRPSAAAKRLGPTAVRLEELIRRDGLPLREAAGILASTGCTLSEGELARLAASLPPHHPAREVSLDVLAEVDAAPFAEPDDPGASDAVRQVERALESIVRELPPQDALILRMRFWNGLSVADIARALGIDQKPLYRRIEVIQSRLRSSLEARGIDRALAAEALSSEVSW
jgi:RNA polymerase sigma factor (sigma-70 family)